MRITLISILLCIVATFSIAEGPTILFGATNEVDLVELAKNRSEWPLEVCFTESAIFPIVIDGKEYGTMGLPIGTKVKIVELIGNEVKVEFMGATKVVPTGSTDLAARVLTSRKAEVENEKPAENLPENPATSTTGNIPSQQNVVPSLTEDKATAQGAKPNGTREQPPINQTSNVPEIITVKTFSSGQGNDYMQPILHVKTNWKEFTAKRPAIVAVLSLKESLSPVEIGIAEPNPEADVEMLVGLLAGFGGKLGMSGRNRVTLRDGSSAEVMTKKNRLGKNSGCIACFIEKAHKRIGAQATFYNLDDWSTDDGVLQLELPSEYFAQPGQMQVSFTTKEQVLWSNTVIWPGTK